MRVPQDAVFVARGNDVDRYKYPATISRLRVLSGGRGVFIDEMKPVHLLHSIAGNDTVALIPQDGGLAPGEYVVTLKLGEDVIDGDDAFLFGVD